MSPLGLQLTTVGALGATGVIEGGRGVVIEDYFFELASAGNLTPLDSGTVSDFHDTWDLDGTDYMPQTEATVSDEGYWDVDAITKDIFPLDV